MVKPDRRGMKAWLIALEVVGVALALTAAAGFYLHWRLSQGPVSLSLVEKSAEAAIARSLPPGHEVDLVNPELVATDATGGVGVTVDSLVVADSAGREVARIADTVLFFSPSDFLRGRFVPREVVAAHAAFDIIRTEDRAFDFVTKEADASVAFEAGPWRDTLKSAHIIDADISFTDEASGRAWRSTRASAKLTVDADAYHLKVDGAFDIGGAPAALALDIVSPGKKAHTEAQLSLRNAPVSDILQTFYGDRAAVVTAPANGEAFLALDANGLVVNSSIKGELGEGVLKMGAYETPLRNGVLDAAFNPAANAFQISEVALETAAGRVALSGNARLRESADGRFAGVEFDFSRGGAQIAAGEAYEEGLDLTDLEIRGVYEADGRRLSIDDFSASLLDVEVVAAGTLARPRTAGGGSPALTLNAAVVGAFDRTRLLKAWPNTIGLGARDFVRERMPAASLDNVSLSVDLPAGAVTDAGLPDDALRLTFDISDAVTIYAPGMKPIRDGRGAATLTGDRFVITDITGRIDSVALRNGDVEFTALTPRGEPVHYRFTAAGDAADVLAILNDEPLSVLASTGFTPERFSGDVEVRVDIVRPNLRDVERSQYTFSGEAAFKDLAVAEFFGGVDLVGGSGAVKLQTSKLEIAADAALGEEPIRLAWTKRLGESGGASTLRLSGVVDSSTGDIFGLQTRQILRGPVAYEATALGEPGRIKSFDITARLDDAALMFDPLGWRKPQGDPATGELLLGFDRDGVVIEKARLQGEGLDIAATGRIAENGAIETLDVERFFLSGSANVAVKAERAPSGQLDASLTGELLTLGPLMEALVESETGAARSEFDWGRGVIVRGRIDELRLREGAAFMDASMDMRHGPDVLETLEASARTMDGAPLSASLLRSAEDGAGPRVDARSDDIGALVRGVFGVTSIEGGEGSMTLRPSPRGAEMRGLDGVLEARNLMVVEAPLLARIFAAGSFDGLSALLNGEGISLNRAYAEFGFRNSVLTLREARATGPSVGITGAGRISQGADGVVALEGAIAPAYPLNSLLGKTPLIGELFVNREGEGVVAIAYDVTGSTGAPVVSVDPLSALAPGVFRRIFESDGPAEEEPASEPAPEPESPPAE